mmetsp:Transcript_30804/g.88994  ORF Transcript_30804/g.88994 Transcript_30804/m.88994 type:complete len:321 (+) Transcript_30804:559-1521(+)
MLLGEVLHGNHSALLDAHLQLGLLRCRVAFRKQVHQVLSVQLQHGTHHGVVEPRLALLDDSEDLADCPRRDSEHAGHARHGKGFPGASLPVCEQRDVVAVNGRLDEIFAILEDFLLGARREDGVEMEDVLPVLADGERHGVDLLRDLVVLEVLLPLVEGPDAAEDPDRALEILDGVVELLSPHLCVGEVRLRNAFGDGALDGLSQYFLSLSHGVDVLHVARLRRLKCLIHLNHELFGVQLSLNRILDLFDLGGVQLHSLCASQRRLHFFQVVGLERGPDLLPCLGSRLLVGKYSRGFLDRAFVDARALGVFDGEPECRHV